MIKKIVKGQRNYIKAKRTRVILMTILFFGLSLAIFLMGYFTTGTKRNLLTVVAILGCLPSCKSAVNMIMFIKAKGCSDVLANRIKESTSIANMYDMYFTSYKKNFALSALVVSNNRLIGISEAPNFDTQACNEHLGTMLGNAGFSNVTITLTTDSDKYINMLKNLENEDKAESNKDAAIMAALSEIIL